jgi:N-acetylneuraminic acid mutarotase
MKNSWKMGVILFSFLALLAACEKSSDDTTPTTGPKWTWVSGSTTVNQAGTYGTQGVSNSSNVPGAREEAVSWLDSSGKLWLFGGYGYDSAGYIDRLNDLWKFDPAALEWTWVSGSHTVNQAGTYGTQGVADPSNVPGARNGVGSWLDSSGSFWLFGGLARDSAGNIGQLNDLWKYDPTTLEWTWVSGSNVRYQAGTYGTQGIADPSNVPGARVAAVSWIDSQGGLWLFGGFGYDSAGTKGWLNDLWKYDPATLSWTWVSGSTTGDQLGTYGTKGVADSSNVPGGRYEAASWLDSSDNLWLFGGKGLDYAGSLSGLNDLWKFDPANLEWTWVSGSQSSVQTGTYGTQGVAASSNVPASRYATASWLDSSGDLWLFGGWGYDGGSIEGRLNDLWKFNPETLEWTWVSGSSSHGKAGTYGTQGTADSSNIPGARYSAASWIDPQGKHWIFGGYGLDSAGKGGWLNDLWH